MAQATREPQGYPTPDAAQQANDEMWRTFRKQFQNKPITYGTILVLFGFFIGAILFHYDPTWNDNGNNLFSYFTNFGTELLGVVFTIFVVNEFQKRRDRDQLGRELFAAVKYGGPPNANQALAIMRSYDDDLGWYSGEKGLLVGANLFGANLEGVDLSFANLSGAILCEADLENANLTHAVLTNSDFRKANLSKIRLSNVDLKTTKLYLADLSEANLQSVDLEGTSIVGTCLSQANLLQANLKKAELIMSDLSDAKLIKANLEMAKISATSMKGANLRAAQLKNAEFFEVEFSNDTILPNAEITSPDESGSISYSQMYETSQGIDQLLRFTDPSHFNFWNPCEELIVKDILTYETKSLWYCDENQQKTPSNE